MVESIRYEPHATAYHLCKSKKYGNELCGRAILKCGKLDSDKWSILEAPKSYAVGHRSVLKKLGIKSNKAQRDIMKKISYY